MSADPNTKKLLRLIANKHSDWLGIVTAKLSGDSFAEDIVQEMYIKLSRHKAPDALLKDEVWRKALAIRTLSTLCIDYQRKKQRVNKYYFADVEPETSDDNFFTDGLGIDEIKERHSLHEQIKDALRSESHHLNRLYLAYTEAENPSYRDIAEATGISLTTIYNDMQNIKKIITEKILKDGTA